MRSSIYIPFSFVLPRSRSPWHYPLKCLCQVQSYRAYSSLSGIPLIKARSIPAPHAGFISVLSLASPANKNAISQQLLHELSSFIDAIYGQWELFEGQENGLSRMKTIRRRAKENPDLEKTEGVHGTDLPPGGALTPRDLATSTRVLILSSEVDGAFCAGADLKERAGMSIDETRQFLGKLRGALSRLSWLPIPTISAISGLALGGGLELALATTFRVLSTTATVGLPETRLGIIPGAGGPRRLESLVGRTKAADLILTGRRVNGKEAFAMSLCERLVDENKNQARELNSVEQRDDTTLGTAIKMANDICEGGPIATGAALRVTGRSLGTSSSRENAIWEEEMYERVVSTEDRNEALIAFREKRKPKFKGR